MDDSIEPTAGPSSAVTGSSSSTISLTNVPLRPGDSFDWEAYTSAYTGQARAQRLMYIATHCPPLRQTCSKAAAEYLKEHTRDVAAYQSMITTHNTEPGTGELVPASYRISADAEWIQSTQQRNNAEREKLELEMRNYQNNLIKESIRMAHRDLGDHFWDTGDHQEALKSYTKTRDYCSTTDHVIEMCMNVIEVSLRLGILTNVQTFVSKAEGVLESYVPSGNAGGRKLSSLERRTLHLQSEGPRRPELMQLALSFVLGAAQQRRPQRQHLPPPRPGPAARAHLRPQREKSWPKQEQSSVRLTLSPSWVEGCTRRPPKSCSTSTPHTAPPSPTSSPHPTSPSTPHSAVSPPWTVPLSRRRSWRTANSAASSNTSRTFGSCSKRSAPHSSKRSARFLTTIKHVTFSTRTLRLTFRRCGHS